MNKEPFDIHEHRRARVAQLEQRCSFLEGERERLEQLLALLLLMAARTIAQPPGLILDALIETHGTDPARAHIHQTPTAPEAGSDAIAA